MVSLSKIPIVLWGCMLMFLSMRGGYLVQAVITFLLLVALLPSQQGDAYLLLPFALLSERCLQESMSLGHTPLPFYAAAFSAYLSSFPAQWRSIGRVALFGGIVSILLGSLTGNVFVGIGVIAFVLIAAVVRMVMDKARFTSREAILVSALCGFIALDGAINSNLDVPEHQLQQHGKKASGIVGQLTATQVTTFPHVAGRSALLASLGIALCMFAYAHSSKSPKGAEHHSELSLKRNRTIAFLLFTSLWTSAAYGWTWYIFGEEPLTWLWVYLHSNKPRLYALMLWVTGVPLAVLCIELFSSNLRKVVRRKMFHFVAVTAFLPMAVLDPSFLSFAIVGATSLAIVVEIGRASGAKGSGVVDRFVSQHIDSRDQTNGIVRTHLYLMFGFGLSMWFRHRASLLLSRPTPTVVELALNVIPGVVVLGIVDSFAAIGGTWAIGLRHSSSSSQKGAKKVTPPRPLSSWVCGKLFPTTDNAALTHKTLHGLLAGLTSGVVVWGVVLFGYLFLIAFLTDGVATTLGNEIIRTVPWKYVGPSVVTVVIASVFEALCDGVDNLELPLVAYGAALTLFAAAYS